MNLTNVTIFLRKLKNINIVGKVGISIILALLILTVSQPAVAYSKPQPSDAVKIDPKGSVTALPKIDTEAYVLVDADSGNILLARSEHKQLRPASTLKTLTMLTLLPRLKQTDKYKASVADDEAEGSEVGLIPGQTYTIKDLFAGLALPSGNDAAEGLARANGGVEKTVQQMNHEALRIGASDTHAVNPSGLDGDGQYSSAADLSQIFRTGLTVPAFVKLVGTETYNFPDKNNGGTIPLYTQDKLITHKYPGIIGGKTGYTTEAGRTFVAAAQQNKHTLIVALLNIGGNTETTATELLDWGFENYDHLTPIGKLPKLPTASKEEHGKVNIMLNTEKTTIVNVKNTMAISWTLGILGALIGLALGIIAYRRNWLRIFY